MYIVMYSLMDTHELMLRIKLSYLKYLTYNVRIINIFAITIELLFIQKTTFIYDTNSKY